MANKININAATTSQIEKIPGITRTQARKIIEARNRLGGFQSIADVRDVADVDEETFDALTRMVVVAVKPAEAQPDLILTINLDPNAKFPGRFAGYKVAANYTFVVTTENGERTPAQPGSNTAYASADGKVVVTIPAARLLESFVTLTVRNPSGEIVATRELKRDELMAPVAMAVVPLDLPATQPTENPNFGKPQRLRGRVIDKAGRIQIAGKQVIIYAATKEEPTDKDFSPVLASLTDQTGYFSGNYPLGEFTSAFATVALDRVAPVTVHLNEDGNFPADVIVVIDVPMISSNASEEDCGCNGPGKNAATQRNPDADDLVNSSGFSADVGQGRCVDFTRPDRTLQEFSYSYVVRTTEPNIKGMTLDEPPKVPGHIWAEMLSLSKIGAANRVMASVEQSSNQAVAGQNTLMALRINTDNAMQPINQLFDGIADFSPNLDDVTKSFTRADKLKPSALAEIAISSRYKDLINEIHKVGRFVPERSRLDCRRPVDWDFEPTIYQACTIAHGHILHFKQEWIADGYSMGRLLYSLPLAPGQKKQIAVLDWERRETAVRQESSEEQESLVATLSRDRDIGEMVNSILTESSRGGSSADTGSFGGGLGIGAILGPVGGLLGIGGGYSSASSSAWQNSSRDLAANSLQTLRDRTSQAASAMRAQRSTVVQTVSQGERVSVVTETVANYNHCHAMTVEYFEVLRHMIVRQRLVDVQECLFVPLLMSPFDRPKALRWRNTLQTTMPTRDLRAGFDALERIDNNYDGSDLPVGTYGDQLLDYVEGDLIMRFQLARPRDKDDDFEPANWGFWAILIPSLSAQEQYKQFLKDQQFKDRIFMEQMAPRIAKAFIELLQFSWVDENNIETPLPIDPTLLSNFVNDSPLSVSLRLGDALNGVARKRIKFIKISEKTKIGPFLFDVLPAGSRVIVEGGNMSYRTKFASGYLFRNNRILNDLTGYDAVRIYTPLNTQELRNPREEDKERARRLIDHLNENIERYHHALWWRMSPDRRFMLLDGFEAPNSGGRSVASVVQNRLIGIVGNSMIMPVAPGFHLDPTYKQDVENPINLLEHYQPNTPIEPVRVAIPTRGVYAEAVLGSCNSCEVKEEERFWRWEESPIPDNPPAILPTSTDTRRADPGNLQAKDFPAPIVAFQNVPAAPDPTGLGSALNLLGQSNLFKDITGLDANQRNAIEGLKAALSTAQSFGDKASNLALQAKMSKDIDRTMRTIDTARQQGLLTDDQARSLTQGAIQSMIGAGPTTDPKPMTTTDVGKLTETAGANAAAVRVSRPGGEQVEVDARPLADSVAAKPVIILGTDTAGGARRGFNSASHDISGQISVDVQVRNAPSGATVRWSAPEPDALEIVSPAAQSTVVKGKRPGLTNLDVALLDGANQVASTRLKICVPQFVTINEDAVPFTNVLKELGIDGRKADVLAEIKRTCKHLLATTNVRTVWLMAPFSETLPAHLPANLVTTATIKGEPPAGQPNLFGQEIPTAAGDGPTVFNETVEIFPGAYDNPVAGGSDTMVDVESQAILMQIKNDPAPSADLLNFAVKVFGRLIGETLAHEIIHSILGDLILGGTGHNTPKIANDLMNRGADRSFRQRTGIEDTTMTSPVIPSNFIDHGLAAIGGLQAANQALVDAHFPVPPKFV